MGVRARRVPGPVPRRCPRCCSGWRWCSRCWGWGVALRTIPVGTGYAVWVGIGAVGTAAYGMVALGEPATVARLTCLVLIIAGVVGLKALH